MSAKAQTHCKPQVCADHCQVGSSPGKCQHGSAADHHDDDGQVMTHLTKWYGIAIGPAGCEHTGTTGYGATKDPN
eukprot:12427962-Karenia_brevis.AAC.1